MIAKYNGKCKITGQKIIAGATEIENIDGVWQATSQPITQDATEDKLLELAARCEQGDVLNVRVITGDAPKSAYQWQGIPQVNAWLLSYRRSKSIYQQRGICFEFRIKHIQRKEENELDEHFWRKDS